MVVAAAVPKGRRAFALMLLFAGLSLGNSMAGVIGRWFVDGELGEKTTKNMAVKEDTDIAFGLCDLGMGFPELGSVSISELESVQVHGLSIERDLSFKADKPISEYSRLARQNGHIVESSEGRSR